MSPLVSWSIIGAWLLASIIIGIVVGRAIDMMGGEDDD